MMTFERIKLSKPFQITTELVGTARKNFALVLPRKLSLRFAVAASLMLILYWGIIASDRYVSEAHVVIHRVDRKDTSTGELLAEQYLLRDHLLSVDMAEKLDSRLNLRAHYSDWRRDPFSRMWSQTAPMERFHQHYLSRVSVEFDPAAAVLVVKVQAYDANTAHAIASLLVEEGERYMNIISQRMIKEQVAFLEQQVAQLNERLMRDRQEVMNFQNSNRLAAPQGMAEQIAANIGRLDAQLTDLQTRRAALLGYLMPTSANIVDIDLQIAAVKKQIAHERKRLASPGGQALNKTVDEYQRLEMKAKFTEELYKTALTALEQGRIEAVRKLLQVSVLQSPTMPQYPLEPKRIYNIIVSIIFITIIVGIMHLLAAIINDHKD